MLKLKKMSAQIEEQAPLIGEKIEALQAKIVQSKHELEVYPEYRDEAIRVLFELERQLDQLQRTEKRMQRSWDLIEKTKPALIQEPTPLPEVHIKWTGERMKKQQLRAGRFKLRIVDNDQALSELVSKAQQESRTRKALANYSKGIK